jgi:hypothetical protein
MFSELSSGIFALLNLESISFIISTMSFLMICLISLFKLFISSSSAAAFLIAELSDDLFFDKQLIVLVEFVVVLLSISARS